jgi:hypothetical protein
MEGLNRDLGNAFTVGIKLVSSHGTPYRDLILRSLEEIFGIMCYQPCQPPLVLAAAYISLLRIRTAFWIPF